MWGLRPVLSVWQHSVDNIIFTSFNVVSRVLLFTSQLMLHLRYLHHVQLTYHLAPLHHPLQLRWQYDYCIRIIVILQVANGLLAHTFHCFLVAVWNVLYHFGFVLALHLWLIGWSDHDCPCVRSLIIKTRLLVSMINLQYVQRTHHSAPLYLPLRHLLIIKMHIIPPHAEKNHVKR